ncbi:MAG: energy transducer TonB [bacterium]|nr:energy transducer TonB [bacterium]
MKTIFKKHRLAISFLISLLVHLLILLFYPRISSIELFPLKAEDLLKPAPQPERHLKFELVETPDDARSEIPPDATNLLSDKNAIARNPLLRDDKPEGAPYSEGDFDVKTLPIQPTTPSKIPEGGSAAKLTDSEASDKKQRQASAYEYSYEKFSRSQLLKDQQSQQPTPSAEQQLNRPEYDNRQFSVRDIGGLTFNTYEWDFAPYMLAMKKKVERNIFPPPAFTYMGLISGETLVRFKVLPGGEIKDLTVLQYSGHESLKETSVQAILNSFPFKPLPAHFPEDFLEVTAKFSYYVKR